MLEINDPTILKVFPLYQEAVANEAAMLNSGLGKQHPKVKSLRAQKDVYARQLTEQIDSVRRSLEIKRNIAKSTNDDPFAAGAGLARRPAHAPARQHGLF